jgi:hypothetical protein
MLDAGCWMLCHGICESLDKVFRMIDAKTQLSLICNAAWNFAEFLILQKLSLYRHMF